MNSAVRPLHNALVKMNNALTAEKKAVTALKTAGTTEKAALAKIAAQSKAIVDQFTSATPPSAADVPGLLNKEFSLGRQQAQTVSRFDAAVTKDKKVIANDQKAVTADRKQALKALRPAELHLSLKDTNHARKELGLKALSKPIRAPSTGNTAVMRRLATDARATAMSMGGFVSHGLCATGVSRTIDKAMGIFVGGNGNQIDNNLPRDKFKEIHISLADALKKPGVILTWEHTSTALGSIFGHTAVTLGDGHSSASDFIERDTLAGNRSRTGLKMFVPI